MNSIARTFTSRALSDLETLPLKEKADLYDFAAAILHQDGADEESAAATQAASHLREAESSQLLLQRMLEA